MDEARIGVVIRSLRIRKGWRQRDLGQAARLSQAAISAVERGHIGMLSLETVKRVLLALDARLVLEVRWRGGDLERLLDARHAALTGHVADLLRSYGWEVRVEVTYSHYGERGSIDILAWHPSTATLLVVEIKTDLTSSEATLRKLDEKERLAPRVAAERFGWRARRTSRILVLPRTSAQRRRVDAADGVLGPALPIRGRAVRAWLRNPSGALHAVWFVSDISASALRSVRRVRARDLRGTGAATKRGCDVQPTCIRVSPPESRSEQRPG